MNQTRKLLESIVENAHTGADACDQLMHRADDSRMRDELKTEKAQYERFAREAEQSLIEAGERPREKGPLSRAGMWMGIQMNTMTDATSTHIADMIIQGATMGVIGMTRDRNRLPDADERAHDIAANFITAQQETIDKFKNFL